MKCAQIKFLEGIDYQGKGDSGKRMKINIDETEVRITERL